MRQYGVLISATSLWLTACGSARQPDQGTAAASASQCTTCHGDPSRQPVNVDDPAWPPVAPAPPVAFSESGVGAHLSHLLGGPIRSPIRCTECHPYPTDTTHASQPLQFGWGPLATAHETKPAFDLDALTCANYCHGATLSGGSNTHPKWTIVDGTQDACGSCHGVPPPPPHPTVTQGDRTTCNRCHGGTVKPDGTIDTVGGFHINGTLDFSGNGSCTGCHGDANRSPYAIAPAPPLDLSGSGNTSSPGVGAHQSHLQGGPIRSAIACTDCHPYPSDLSHASEPLHFAWSSLATGNGATTPSFDPNALTCSNYCHGATIVGGSNKTPIWNVVNGSQMACGTCHALPPTSNHPSVGDGTDTTVCNQCHAGTVDSNGHIIIPPSNGLHINGTVDFGGSGGDCTGCHGDPTRTAYDKRAPPKDTKGNVAATAPGVGAHQSHLQGGPIRGPIECTQCHVVPTDISHAGQPLQLTWGNLATAGGVTPTPPNGPSFSLTCTNYCHGATLSAGSNNRPIWNVVDGSQMACGTCHGLPPGRLSNGGMHFTQFSPGQPITRSDCWQCHVLTVDKAGNIMTSNGKHINGTVDFNAP